MPTLLLADDSITIQRVIELTFADEDVRVVCAGDGQAAIQKIEVERPDIVLADVGMPSVDGYGVARHVKQSPALRHIPVLLLTGAFEPIDEAKARASGCDGILVKPFESQMLIARVRELLSGQHNAALWPAELPRVEETPKPIVPRQNPALSFGVPSAIVPEVARPVAAPVHAPPPSPVEAPPATASIEPRVAEPQTASGDTENLRFPEDPEASQHDMLRPANRNPPAVANRTQTPRELPPPADAFESELDMLDVALSRLEPTARPHELDAATASDFARDLEELRSELPEDEQNAPIDAPSGAADTLGSTFGDWDLPPMRAPGVDTNDIDLQAPIDVVPEELPHPAPAAPPAPAPPRRAVAPPALAAAPPPAPAPPPAAATPAPVPAPAPVAAAPVPAAPRAAVAAPKAPAQAIPPPAAPIAPVAPPPPAPLPPRPSLASAFSALLAAERAQPPARTLASSNMLSEGAIEDVVKKVLARMTDQAVQKVVLDAAERIIREEIERLKASSDSSGR
jgi:CheY-like chemotaxis protein